MRIIFTMMYLCPKRFVSPIVAKFSDLANETLKGVPVTGLYCHSGYLGKKVRDVDDFDWNNVKLGDVVEDTEYPQATKSRQQKAGNQKQTTPGAEQ